MRRGVNGGGGGGGGEGLLLVPHLLLPPSPPTPPPILPATTRTFPSVLSHSPEVKPASSSAILSPLVMLKSNVNLRMISVGTQLEINDSHGLVRFGLWVGEANAPARMQALSLFKDRLARTATCSRLKTKYRQGVHWAQVSLRRTRV